MKERFIALAENRSYHRVFEWPDKLSFCLSPYKIPKLNIITSLDTLDRIHNILTGLLIISFAAWVSTCLSCITFYIRCHHCINRRLHI